MIAAPRARVWSALQHYTATSLRIPEGSPIARLLGTQSRAGFEVLDSAPAYSLTVSLPAAHDSCGGCRMPRCLLSVCGGRRGLGDTMVGEMTDMDIAGMWRSMRADPAEAPHPGAQQQVAGEGITIVVTQQCQATLPLAGFTADEVTVTVTSHRPGVAAQVSIGANLNSPDGSYQGPTTTVGHGQFTTAARSRVRAGFAVLPSGWPVLGVGAEAIWEDGAPHSIALVYEQLACDPWVWWRWPIRILDLLTRPFLAGISSLPPRSSKG
jgi:hypothetical protein